MEIDPSESESSEEDVARTILQGFAESRLALCLCDTADLIRFANPSFRAAFFPAYDGRPADFMTTILAAIEADTGIRLVSASPEEFATAIRRRRHALFGSQSFAVDTLDGSWWSVTDTKLSNDWLLIVAQDISALKTEEARLRDAHEMALAEAQTDFLTSVPNRRHGLRQAEALWNAAVLTRVPLSLALLDIDHFKAINDTHGHDAGDRALVHFGRHMTQALAPGNQLSRLGGDEFMLVSTQAAAGGWRPASDSSSPAYRT